MEEEPKMIYAHVGNGMDMADRVAHYKQVEQEATLHSHYFKDVSKLRTIDVYRVLQLFEVADPCLQHTIKKLLVPGGRGHKPMDKDVQDAIDSLVRWQHMRKEDAK